MITGRAVSALLLHHHRRVVVRRAVNYDFAGALGLFDPRVSRALVNLADKVPLHWNRTSTPTNAPTSRKNTVSTTKE